MTGRGYRDLKVYTLAYELAMEVFEVSKAFPRDEKFSLTDQIRRSSRNVAADIAEGYRKRQYPNLFVMRLADSNGEASETEVWLDFAHDCGYLATARHRNLMDRYAEVGRMLAGMINDPTRFIPSGRSVAR